MEPYHLLLELLRFLFPVKDYLLMHIVDIFMLLEDVLLLPLATLPPRFILQFPLSISLVQVQLAPGKHQYTCHKPYLMPDQKYTVDIYILVVGLMEQINNLQFTPLRSKVTAQL